MLLFLGWGHCFCCFFCCSRIKGIKLFSDLTIAATYSSIMSPRLTWIKVKNFCNLRNNDSISYTEKGNKDEIPLTKLLTINSARETDSLQAPPIMNEMFFPMMVNGGEVRVPWGPSPCESPGRVSLEGRSSYPPIHQSPCWLAGEENPRAVGLSP